MYIATEKEDTVDIEIAPISTREIVSAKVNIAVEYLKITYNTIAGEIECICIPRGTVDVTAAL